MKEQAVRLRNQIMELDGLFWQLQFMDYDEELKGNLDFALRKLDELVLYIKLEMESR